MASKDEPRRSEQEATSEEPGEGTEGRRRKGEVSGGIASGILQELGGFFPGLDQIVKGLERSAVFRERLQAIDQEIETRLRSQPLVNMDEGDKASSMAAGYSRRDRARRSIPGKRQASPRAKEAVVPFREPLADVFDEGTYLRVVVELPGVTDQDVTVSLNEAQLEVSAKTATHDYYKRITLPYAPQGQMVKLCRNGILELVLPKE